MKRAMIAFFGSTVLALAAAAQPHVALREGLIVDPSKDVAYVMQPRGGIAAVDLNSGSVQWTSGDADKPLALVGEVLVSQAAPKTPAAARRLEIVTFDVGARRAARGDARTRRSIDLPSGVRAFPGQTPHGTFTATGLPSGANAIVNWTFTPMPARGGMRPDPAEERPGGPTRAIPAPPQPQSGTVRVNVATGRMSRLDTAPEAARASQTPQWLIPSSQRDASPATEYRSADGRHVLVSERLAGDRSWNKYRWSIVDRATGMKFGEMPSHYSFRPFVVRDSVVIFETPPFARGSSQPEPAKLRGVSLETGAEVWSIPVGEVVYRGPMPP